MNAWACKAIRCARIRVPFGGDDTHGVPCAGGKTARSRLSMTGQITKLKSAMAQMTQ